MFSEEKIKAYAFIGLNKKNYECQEFPKILITNANETLITFLKVVYWFLGSWELCSIGWDAG